MFGEYSYFSEALWGIFPKIEITRDPHTPHFVQNSGVVTYCKFDQILQRVKTVITFTISFYVDR